MYRIVPIMIIGIFMMGCVSVSTEEGMETRHSYIGDRRANTLDEVIVMVPIGDDGEYQKTDGKNACRYLNLDQRRPVNVNLSQRIRGKSRRQKSYSLFDIDAEPDQHRSDIECDHVFACFGNQEEQEGDHADNQGCPAVKNNVLVFADSDKQVL